MEPLIASGSVPGMLAAVAVLLSIQLVVKVGEVLWNFKKEKDSVTEQGIKDLATNLHANTIATQNLETRLKELESIIGDMAKVKLDLRRVYSAIKSIAGDRWGEIREDIMQEI